MSEPLRRLDTTVARSRWPSKADALPVPSRRVPKLDQRSVFGFLTKPRLIELAANFKLAVPSNRPKAEFVDALVKRAPFDKVLALLSPDELGQLCRDHRLDDSGSEKQLLDRLLGQAGAPAVEPPTMPQGPRKPARSERPSSQAELLLIKPEPVESSLDVTTPQVDRPPPKPTLPQRPNPRREPDISEPAESPDPLSTPLLSRPVPTKQPRLVWHGWDTQELTTAVPTQVVEIVRPMLVKDRAGELAGIESSGRKDKSDSIPNRLIWTNDNIVALKTLLDERCDDGGYRYRHKVDLIYIDPPFMVQSDFLAQNSIDIDLSDEQGVQVTKEPSLVEILAYRDTWRQGLDSFLSMLRARLVLLKELLAPTGSIYVHLDWHAVHYVKVLLDEVFGYENFLSEIVWKRTFARSDAQGFNRVHDTILSYGSSAEVYLVPVMGPHNIDYIRSHYSNVDQITGRRYQLTSLDSPNPRPTMMYEWKGFSPPANGWRFSLATMISMDQQGLISYPRSGRPRFKRFLDDDGMPIQTIWTDISPVNSQSKDRLGYPTQKPVELVERIISGSCPEGGLVLDCFVGSGTTVEAAERLGRRWIGVDNGKYAIHLARKRLIQLHGQKRPSAKSQHEYIECEQCKNIERRERPARALGMFDVRPFTIENMGVYQRAEEWQDFQTQKSDYRDEMIRVFGGEPIRGYRLLHGQKGESWIHIGPLDGPVSISQVWDIAREARRTERRHVTVLSADFNTISADEHQLIARQLDGMRVTIRVIPAAAIDEIRRRIEHQITNPNASYSSTTIPAFYAPLAIVLRTESSGRLIRVYLERCEVDIESFLASQRPTITPITDGMSDAKRKKAAAEQARWSKRRKELEDWLAKAQSWRAFVDFWAIDWSYGERIGRDGKPIFETDWQSFRQKKAKGSDDELAFVAERNYDEPGRYRVAARVTDVFGNDGIATDEVNVE